MTFNLNNVPKKEIKIINVEKIFCLIPFLYRVYFGQKYQDLLLVIEQLKEQVREVQTCNDIIVTKFFRTDTPVTT